MTGRRWELQTITKDAWALLPMWLACALAIAVAGKSSPLVALIPYGLGAAALGAMSIGHEYSHRTLASLLTLPLRRWQILAMKLAVLAVMLGALGSVAWFAGLNLADVRWPIESPPPWLQPIWFDGVMVLLLPVMCGLFVAPWLTMLARGSLAGTVFTGGIVAVMWFAGDAMAISRFGLPQGSFTEVDAFRSAFVWRGGLMLCAVASVLIWPTFRRLQATDGPGVAIVLPQWRWLNVRTSTDRLDAPPPRRRHWAVQLIAKELHLHQMVFAVTALYLVAWLGILWWRRLLPLGFAFPLAPVTALYAATVALLIGSFTIAEERQLGTLASQLLQPVSAWRQWIVKLTTAVALAILLGIGVPRVLEVLADVRDMNVDTMIFWHPVMVSSLLVAGIYVSSLSTGGLKALIVSMPVGAIALMLSSAAFHGGYGPLANDAYNALRPRLGNHPGLIVSLVDRPTLILIVQCLLFAVAVLPAGIAVWFAFRNHRSSERHRRLILRQALWILIGVLFVPVAHGVIFACLAATAPGR